jgi:hypothetical protein
MVEDGLGLRARVSDFGLRLQFRFKLVFGFDVGFGIIS